MLFQIIQICFNESNYVTLHSTMNIMTENGAKMTYKMPERSPLDEAKKKHKTIEKVEM